MANTYWTVTLKVMAFETKEEAEEYAIALTDAFMEMPESEEYCATTTWKEHTDE